MGCGKADFGQRGLKTPQTPKIWPRILSPGVSTRSATWGFDSQLSMSSFPFSVSQRTNFSKTENVQYTHSTPYCNDS